MSGSSENKGNAAYLTTIRDETALTADEAGLVKNRKGDEQSFEQ